MRSKIVIISELKSLHYNFKLTNDYFLAAL